MQLAGSLRYADRSSEIKVHLAMSFLLLPVGLMYIAFAFWIAVLCTRDIGTKFGRISTFLAVAAALLVLPIADGIWGNYQLKKLCTTESRTEILGRIPVPVNVLGPDGKPRKMEGYDGVDWSRLRPYLYYETREDKAPVNFAEIQRAIWVLIRVADGAEVVRQTDFSYRGGWLRTNGEGPGAGNCIATPSFDSIVTSIVVPQS